MNPTTAPPRLPTRAEVRAAIPDECFERSTGRAMMYLAGSFATVAALVFVGTLIPMTWAWAPVWVLYAIVTGTAAVGLWVIAHECGHGAFSPNQALQDTIGFVLHSALLVPYFSWQRSHAVHHARTNHLDEGETHVPSRIEASEIDPENPRANRTNSKPYATLVLSRKLLLGWPVYLLTGASGSERRGPSNHFWPIRPFKTELFPQRWHARVWASAAGVAVVIALLVAAAVWLGPVPVLLLYVGPYFVVNAWLVGYTWLQHTDVDIPHYREPEWSWLLGAFQTVDRPYGRLCNLLHHRIGSTHVAHHIDHRIPHYRAVAATDAIKSAFGEWYRYDPTPVPVAMWRVGRECVSVSETEDGWRY